MLLTIKQPAHHPYKPFHDYTPPTPPSTGRFSPVVSSTGPVFPPISAVTNKSLPPLPTAKTNSQQPMSAPHRGLPPPVGMPLPQPSQQQPPIGQPPLSHPMVQLPAPPQQWQGAEESMRNWLHAKAEEDKRKQEEEKTRQESLRLEQRKIEQDMLRTSLSGGIPPYMIPMVFAGMGGGNLPNASLEWAQHYMAQMQQQQQAEQIQVQAHQQLLPSQSHTSPEQLQRRDSRAYGQHQNPPPMTLPSTPIGPAGSQGSFGPMSPISRARQIAQPHSQTSAQRQSQNSLPRLNTGEMHAQPLPGSVIQTASSQAAHPLQQSQTAQQESQQSPSIYFHHWQPPTSQTDHTSSPKKRKATGPQQAAPPPTSQPQYTSPPFSQGGSSVSNTPQSRRRGHSRQRSDLSARGYDTYARPSSRHRAHTESGFSTHSLASPIQEQGPPPPTTSSEPRRRSGGSHPVSSMLDQSDSRSQSQSQPHQQMQASSRYSAGPEMRHHERHATPDEDNPRRANAIKRDDTRD